MGNQKNIKSAIWGFIVGDALGVPYEFTDRETMKAFPATGMIGYGTHHQPAGTWSDDSSLMLCVLENLIHQGGPRDLADSFVNWYTKGYMTAHGEVFDIGHTTRNAIDNLIAEVKPHLSGGNRVYSAGNGSLMRCLPYAFKEDISKSINSMIIENKITHRSHLCHLCCIFYVWFVKELLDGGDKLSAMKYAIACIKFRWNISDDEEESTHLGWGNFKKLFAKGFSSLPESEIQSTGYVLSTLEAVIWCFLNTDNYKDAVLKAVNLGGDTDTIAALTGGVAGLYYGYNSIQEEWISAVANPSIIISVLNKIDTNTNNILI